MTAPAVPAMVPLSGRVALGARLRTALILCAAVACHSAAVADESGRGTVVIAVPTAVTNIFPHSVSNATDEMVAALLYDHLADIGPRLNTVGDEGFTPVLAQGWTWSRDSLSITFALQPAARWHDGRPVRSEDVRFSVDLARNPALKSDAPRRLANIDSVHVRDSVTLTVHFRARAPDQFYELASQVPIVPAHLLAHASVSDIELDPASRQGIGSGRFRLGQWQPGERLELRADTMNYRGRPGLDRVILITAPDFGAAAAQFLSGAADIFEHLSPPMARQISASARQRVLVAADQSVIFLAFNMRDPVDTTRPHPIFGDRAVRRALTMAVSRDGMLRNVFDGNAGAALLTPVPSSIVLASTMPTIPFSVAESRRSLDAAGWRLAHDGFRAKGGRRLAFSIVVPNSSTTRRQYSVLLQQAFRSVGADANIEVMDFPAFVAQEHRRAFDTELATGVVEPGVNALRAAWTMGDRRGSEANVCAYDAPEATALFERAAASFDEPTAATLTARALAEVVADAPAVWLAQPFTLVGVNARIHTTPLLGRAWWETLAEWSIPVALRTAGDRISLARPAKVSTP